MWGTVCGQRVEGAAMSAAGLQGGGIMNRRYSAVAIAALALGAAGFAATDASAREVPDSQFGNGNTLPQPTHPRYDPQHHGNMATPDCHWAYHSACKEAPAPTAPTAPPTKAELNAGSSGDNGAEALQLGASALGGAALAFGGMWAYRRFHAPAV